MTIAAQKPEDLVTRIITKAWEEEAFKQALLKEPKATIERELEVELPDDLEIEIREESANRMCLVLPVRPQELPQGELSTDELEAVAGGVYSPTVQSIDCGGFSRLSIITPSLPASRW